MELEIEKRVVCVCLFLFQGSEKQNSLPNIYRQTMWPFKEARNRDQGSVVWVCLFLFQGIEKERDARALSLGGVAMSSMHGFIRNTYETGFG